MTFEWLELAACRDQGPNLWFGAVDKETYAVRTAREKEAIKVCQICPVRVECLNLAISEDIEHGIWGGCTPRERRRIKSIPVNRPVRSKPNLVVALAPEKPEAGGDVWRVIESRQSWADDLVELLSVATAETWHGAKYAVSKNGQIVFRALDEADAWLFFATVTMT